LKTIEIFVSPTGESRVETCGFSGNKCQQASRFLEQALGKRVQESLKPEFYSQAETKGSVQNEN
jgi:hypothetical protein